MDSFLQALWKRVWRFGYWGRASPCFFTSVFRAKF